MQIYYIYTHKIGRQIHSQYLPMRGQGGFLQRYKWLAVAMLGLQAEYGFVYKISAPPMNDLAAKKPELLHAAHAKNALDSNYSVNTL